MKRRTLSKIVVLAIVLPIAVRAWQRVSEVVGTYRADVAAETLDAGDAAPPDSTDQ